MYFFFRSLIAYVFFAATYHLLSVDYIVPHPTESVRRSRMTSTKLLHQLYDSVFKPFSFFFLYYSSNVWLYPPAQKTKQNNNQKKETSVGVLCILAAAQAYVTVKALEKYKKEKVFVFFRPVT